MIIIFHEKQMSKRIFEIPTGIKKIPLGISIPIGFEQNFHRIFKSNRKFQRKTTRLNQIPAVFFLQ